MSSASLSKVLSQVPLVLSFCLLSVVIQNYSVPEGGSSLLLSGLTPGALYRLQASTVSGGLRSASVSLQGRTCKMDFCSIIFL